MVEYTAMCGGMSIQVSTSPVPHLIITPTKGTEVRIDATDRAAIKLLRQSISHIIDAHKEYDNV